MKLRAAMAVIAGMESELAMALVGVGIVLSFGTLPLLYMIDVTVGLSKDHYGG